MAYVVHGELTADQVEEVELPNRSFGSVEVLNRSGDAEIFFLVLNSTADTDPTVGGEGCEVLPAAMSALEVSAPDPGPVKIRMISSGTPTYSVRAE